MSIVELTLNEFLVFTLVLLRMSGLVVFAPFFGGETFPTYARIGLASFLSFVAFPGALATLGGMGLPLNLVELGVLGVRELLVGVVIGYTSGFIFTGAQLAGELIGQQVGFALANVVDPVTDQETGLISFLKFTLTMVVFLGLGLHLFLIHILALSYRYVGLGQAVFRRELVGGVSELFSRIWDIGIVSGGPVLLVMMMVSVLIGFLVRTMPQLNIMVVGLPVRTLIGLVALMIAVRPFAHTMAILSEDMMADIALLITLLAPPQTG